MCSTLVCIYVTSSMPKEYLIREGREYANPENEEECYAVDLHDNVNRQTDPYFHHIWVDKCYLFALNTLLDFSSEINQKISRMWWRIAHNTQDLPWMLQVAQVGTFDIEVKDLWLKYHWRDTKLFTSESV